MTRRWINKEETLRIDSLSLRRRVILLHGYHPVVLFRLKFRGVIAEQRRVIASLDHCGMGKRDRDLVPTVSFESLSYTVNGVQILSDVSGVFRPGELVAVMGGSGSGKTTLIDILTGRRSTGEVTGHILYNDTKLPDAKKWLRKNAGYVVQEDDELARSLTVREVLTFAALLKLSPTEPLADRLMHVEEMIDEFGLRELADTVAPETAVIAIGAVNITQNKRWWMFVSAPYRRRAACSQSFTKRL